ncbi:MAG: hypothetical protein IKO42_00420 [Opitutales bacterium]|nr:hypothetical protein [Opitutales bacterium]
MKIGKIFLAFLLQAVFAALSFAGITWHEDLDALLERAEIEGQTVAFFIPGNGDKTLSLIPEFNEAEFLNFIPGKVLFCKANISLSGKTYKFKDKKIEKFLSKFLKESNTLSKESYKMVLFKHPNRYYVYSGSVSREALKNADKERKENFAGIVRSLVSRSQMFSALKRFVRGSLEGYTVYEKVDQQSGGASGKTALRVMSLSVGELRELAEKEDKFIAFVLSTDVKKVFKQKLFEDENFKNFAAGNIIFVPVRKIYSKSAGKAKIVDAQYSDFILSQNHPEVLGRADIILMYHPKREPFVVHFSDPPDYNCQMCELYKRGGRIITPDRKSSTNIKTVRD